MNTISPLATNKYHLLIRYEPIYIIFSAYDDNFINVELSTLLLDLHYVNKTAIFFVKSTVT